MKINNNTAFKQMKETQFYIDMLINKKLRQFESEKVITVLESIYDADDLKKLKMQFENQKHRAISN